MLEVGESVSNLRHRARDARRGLPLPPWIDLLTTTSSNYCSLTAMFQRKGAWTLHEIPLIARRARINPIRRDSVRTAAQSDIGTAFTSTILPTCVVQHCGPPRVSSTIHRDFRLKVTVDLSETVLRRAKISTRHGSWMSVEIEGGLHPTTLGWYEALDTASWSYMLTWVAPCQIPF